MRFHFSLTMSSPSPFSVRKDKAHIEESGEFAPKFDADGLIPAIAIDSVTSEPLMLAYMNAESLRLSLEYGEAVYWSRSRSEIWHKGKTSGHTQKIVEIRTDCDQDALVIVVAQIGAGACHTGRTSCFYRKVIPGTPAALAFTQSDLAFDPSAVYGKKST
jgi:phosphoribosyl-AMP cyclohydrolase